jgi:hypothetical protein
MIMWWCFGVGQCPLVVRETEDGQWIMIGECFVDSWMVGDAVAKLAREEGNEDPVRSRHLRSK